MKSIPLILDKKNLSEEDICTKYITPAIEKAGWNKESKFLQQVSFKEPFTDGRIYVKGDLTARGKGKRADYILYLQSNAVAVIEAKINKLNVRDGMQQALEYAEILDIPCVFTSNGDGFIFHDRTNSTGQIETELSMDEFPPPEILWTLYKKYKGIATTEAERLAIQPYYTDETGRKPRYYQRIAINRTVEAIANGQNRILLVMATGTGKTYTAFQIAYRLWKSKSKKRILFLADRTALIDQTRRGDFKSFKNIMTVIKKKTVLDVKGKEVLVADKNWLNDTKKGIDSMDKAYQVYLGLYQGLTNSDGTIDAFKDFSPDFFDLIIIDECHRGSANEDSAWREILSYFSNATQIGLTATPKETNITSNSDYFGDALYTYSLKQGIEDGFLAPYRVLRFTLNIDAQGWRPPLDFLDKAGQRVEDRIYNTLDFDKKLVVEERREIVAEKITEFLKSTGDRFAKTIVFCCDIEHAQGMCKALNNANADLAAHNSKYVMQITGDQPIGKGELENFTNVEEVYPVIAVTSELMTTGVDAPTCKVIVLDTNINSMTKFKQIIGRGTRISEKNGKMFFTILDFRNATDLFADPAFDGDAIVSIPVTEDEVIDHIFDVPENIIDAPILDENTGEPIIFSPPDIRHPEFITDGNISENRKKIYVDGVPVNSLVVREWMMDANGKLLTKSLKEHTREIIGKNFASLDDFLNRWNDADRKEIIIEELHKQGLQVHQLESAVEKSGDLFDLICSLAYDQPPLTRKERADNVKKRNAFTKYGDQARRILDALLDKYADEGIANLESLDVLKIKPFDKLGSPMEIIKYFAGKENYLRAVKELEKEIYRIS